MTKEEQTKRVQIVIAHSEALQRSAQSRLRARLEQTQVNAKCMLENMELGRDVSSCDALDTTKETNELVAAQLHHWELLNSLSHLELI